MNITDVKIRKVFSSDEPGTSLRAMVSVTLDDAIALHDIKIIETQERMFVAMPSRKDISGIFRDVVHPINTEARKLLEERILEEYAHFMQGADKVEEKF